MFVLTQLTTALHDFSQTSLKACNKLKTNKNIKNKLKHLRTSLYQRTSVKLEKTCMYLYDI